MQFIKVRFVIRDGGKFGSVDGIAADGGVGFEELGSEDVNDAGEGLEFFRIFEEVLVYFVPQSVFEPLQFWIFHFEDGWMCLIVVYCIAVIVEESESWILDMIRSSRCVVRS